MVDEITPTYYAEGQQLTYTLTGSGFNNLPNDVIGIRSTNNDTPLVWRYDLANTRLYDLTERTDTRIVFTARFTDYFSSAGYLGGIVTNDRNIVFWVNNTRPLPTNRGDIVEPEFIDER